MRFYGSLYISGKTDSTFPLGTLFVNLAGALIIGIAWGIVEFRYMAPELKDFIFVGILGAFTTFSTYSLETVNLIRYNQYKMAALNIIVSNVSGIILAFLGYSIMKYIYKV